MAAGLTEYRWNVSDMLALDFVGERGISRLVEAAVAFRLLFEVAVPSGKYPEWK